jgi:hypothetical protein
MPRFRTLRGLATGIHGPRHITFLSLTFLNVFGHHSSSGGGSYQMKSVHIVLFSATLVLLSSQAFADTVAVDELVNGKPTLVVLEPGQYGIGVPDPRVAIRRLRRGSIPFYGLDFSFDLSDGAGSVDFRNAGSETLYSLTLTISPGGPAGAGPEVFSCGDDSELSDVIPFTNCLFMETGGPHSESIVTFYGGPGLPSQSHFFVTLDGFGSAVQVSAQGGTTPINGPAVGALGSPDPVPEPATLALFIGGVALLLNRHRSRKYRSA